MTQRPTAEELADLLREFDRLGTAAPLRALLRRAQAVEDWSSAPAARGALVRGLIRRGLSRDALELLPPEALPLSPEIEHLRAWALANTGAPVTAARTLTALLAAGHSDSETLGLLGRTEKDLARRAASPEEARRHWLRGQAHYQRAFDATGDTYPGINAAALALRAGRTDTAQALAHQILRTLDSEAAAGAAGDDWALATRAEAQLILGLVADAQASYEKAALAASARRDWNTLGSTVRQARELLQDLELPRDQLDAAFALPSIAVFSGHRIDQPDRGSPRFPATAEPVVRQALDQLLAQQRVEIGYAAAANGADLLFLEALLERGGEAHVVLPMEVESFLALSVASEPDHAWVPRFHRVLERASSLTVVSEKVDPLDPSAFDFGNRVMLGFAQLKAQELGAAVHGISVWDGSDGLPGGTADCMGLWQQQSLPIHALCSHTGISLPIPSALPSGHQHKRQLMGLVFADIVGYSRLSEGDIERFYEQVLPQLGRLCRSHARPPRLSQSFGDAFYFVLDSAVAAAEFGLAVNQLFRERLATFTDLNLKIRIALHAGPLLACVDPLTDTMNYTGRHTSKAARVEPVAPENQILTTQQFAALLALEAGHGFDLAYAGERVLPKGYGSERLYVLSGTTAER